MNTFEYTSQPVEKNRILKAYCPPKLIEYGGLKEITQTVGNTMKANPDGGMMGSLDKTH